MTYKLEDYVGTIINLRPDGTFDGGMDCNLPFNLGFTGHRDVMGSSYVLDKILEMYPNSTWIHGGAFTGFDKQVHDFIMERKIPHRVLRPDYITYPDRGEAPLRRNDEIVKQCRLLVACYDGRKRGGTFYTINRAREANIYVLKIGLQDWPMRKFQPPF